MAYCVRCGKQNEDVAKFCMSCGSPLAGGAPPPPRRREDQCEEECSKGPRSGSVIWGIILLLVGLWVIFELGIRNIQGLPPWLADFQFWWIFPVLLGLVILAIGVRMIFRK